MIVLIAGRAVQGLGAGWILGACYVAIGTMFPQRHLARVFSVTASVWGVATVFGPLIGGLFADTGEWRALFWAFAIQSLAFAAAVPGLAPSVRATAGRRAPWRQLGLVIAGVGLIGAADLTGSPITAACLGASSLVVFVAAVRLREPGGGGLFPRAAGQPSSLIGAAYLSFFALTAASMGFSVYAPALLQKLYGLSPLASGYAAGLESVGWTVAALAVAGLAERWHGAIIRLGGGCIVVAVAALALVMRTGPLAAIFVAATVMGAGFGLSAGFTSRRVIAAAEAGERELAAAGINSTRLVGNSAGACLAGVIANLFGVASGLTPAAARAASVWLFVAAAPVALAGAVGAWRVGARGIREVA
jgi:predicted MFS family arabinose efflux permease